MCTPSTPRFFFNDTAATEIYTLSLHDALPIFGKARLVGHPQELCALRRAQRVLGSSTDRPRPSIALDQPLLGFPALKSAHIDADHLAGQTESGSGLLSDADVLGPGLAIFEADHSSSPVSLLKIAATFFDRTNKAAVSARALSLRRNSRSSSLLRSRS